MRFVSCQGDIKRMYLTNVKDGKEWTTLAKQLEREILRFRSVRRGRRRVSVYAVMSSVTDSKNCNARLEVPGPRSQQRTRRRYFGNWCGSSTQRNEARYRLKRVAMEPLFAVEAQGSGEARTRTAGRSDGDVLITACYEQADRIEGVRGRSGGDSANRSREREARAREQSGGEGRERRVHGAATGG